MATHFKSEIPFIWLLFPVALAILFNNYFPLNSVHFIYFIIAILIVPVIWFQRNFKRKRLFLYSNIITIILFVLVFLLTLMVCFYKNQLNAKNHFSKLPADYLLIVINDEPKIKNDILRFSADVKQVVKAKITNASSGQIMVALKVNPKKIIDLNYGDELLIKADYHLTEPPYNPAEFNYKRFLSYKEIYHQTFINEQEIAKTAVNKGNKIIAFALKLRQKQVDKFNKYLTSANAKSIASTLILGYKSDLSEDLMQAYSKTGTMHVLSVSGMHVAIVVILLDFFLRFMNRKRWSIVLKAIMMLLLIWFYALITGFSASVFRAALMISMVLLGRITRQKINMINVLGASAFLLLLYKPAYLFDVGFQLSYLAVGGLIYMQPVIYGLINSSNYFIDKIWQYLSVSLAAQLATSPLSIFYFHQFPIYFLLSNLFILLPAVLIMYIGLAFIIIPFPDFLMGFLGKLLSWVIDFTNSGLFFIEHLPFSSAQQIWINFLQMLLLTIAAYLLIKAIKYQQKTVLKTCLLLIFIFSIIFCYHDIRHQQQKHLIFFSTRKNAAFAYIKNDKAWVFSNIPTHDNGFKFSIKPYLDSCQVNKVYWFNPIKNNRSKAINLDGHLIAVLQQEVKKQPSKAIFIFSKNKKVIQVNHNPIFIDGNTPDYVAKDIIKAYADKNIKPYLLKRQQAVEVKF